MRILREILPSQKPREDLELAVAEFEKNNPDVFSFEILEEEQNDKMAGRVISAAYVVIYKVHDWEEVEIPDFVREFKVSHLSYRRENEKSQCIFPENLKKIKGGQGLCSISHMFENANFIHTVDVSQLCVKNINKMDFAFSHCKAKGFIGFSSWSFGKLPSATSMFSCAEIEVLEDMFSLVPFFKGNKSLGMFCDAKIAKISDLSSWNTAFDLCEGLIKENLIKNRYSDAIIPDLGFDKDKKNKTEKAKEFSDASAFLQNKENCPLETAIDYCYLLEHMPEGKTADTIEEWFEVYLQDPWEMTFTNEVFEDLLEFYHKNNPKIFEFVTDEQGYIRIKRFFVHNWKKTDFNKDHTIVIPDFVHGFEGNPFGCECDQEELNSIYYGALIFYLGKNVRDLSYMFFKSIIAPKLMLKDWDTSNVTKMDSMFESACFAEIWGLESFVTSRVTSVEGMFYDYGKNPVHEYTRGYPPWACKKKMSIEFKGWDTSSVVSMGRMFASTEFEELNLNGWDVSNVENMDGMFSFSYELKELLIDEWKPKNIKKLNGTFLCCSSLEHLNVGGWDLRNLKSMETVFSDCKSLETLDVSGWILPEKSAQLNVCSFNGGLFSGCRRLKTLDLSSWNFFCFVNLFGMFCDCQNLSIINGDEVLASWDISNVEYMDRMFLNCGITLKNPKKLREIWKSKQHPFCDVTGAFHDMIYGEKPIVKEMEISDFMPDLGLHYEICKWDSDKNLDTDSK